MTISQNTPASAAADAGFDTLALDAATLANLERLGYARMTPVQAAALPLALAGQDLIVQAETGSGKTAAYALALIAKLDTRSAAVQALVLCPTRELADQVAQEIRRLASAAANVKVLTLCGGVPLRGQLASLEHGAHVIVGTPGRVMDHLERNSLDLSALHVLVLDEADRMLDMGFADDIGKVAARCPARRQTLLFSATYPEGIEKIAQRFLRDPRTVKVAASRPVGQIHEVFYQVEESERLHAVGLLLAHYHPASVIAFCNTRRQCRDLAAVLQAQGWAALELHGDLDQRERDQVLVQFANHSCTVLVATDVAARGLDIAQLEAVINVDVTPDPEVHVHRIGRTGRAGEAGLALSLASMDEMGRVGSIEVMRGHEVEWQTLSALAPVAGGPLKPPMRTLQILGGRKEKIRAGDILGALTGEAGFEASRIGKIDIGEFSTYVAVERGIADAAVKRLNAGRVKGRKVKVRFIEDAATSPQPAATHNGPRKR